MLQEMIPAITNNKFTFKKPRRQCFDFPSDVISHLLMNPKSGNGLEKLYQTCKYFFSKRKILVIKQHGHLKDNILYCTFDQNGKTSKCQIDISKIQALLWLAGALVITPPLTTNLKTIYRCSIYKLDIYDFNLSYNDFEFLVSEDTVKDFDLYRASIYYSTNCPVPLDVILKKLPNVEKFWFDSKDETFSAKTLQKMTQIPLNMKLNFCFFHILNISNDFDPVLLCKFFEKHPSCNFKFYIENQRSPEIKESIENVLKEISKTDKTKEYDVTILITMHN